MSTTPSDEQWDRGEVPCGAVCKHIAIGTVDGVAVCEVHAKKLSALDDAAPDLLTASAKQRNKRAVTKARRAFASQTATKVWKVAIPSLPKDVYEVTDSGNTIGLIAECSRKEDVPLIAAAPDLYTALKRLSLHCLINRIVLPKELADLVDKAIAKAEEA